MEEDRQKPTPKRSKWRTLGLVAWITVKWLFIFGLIIGLFAGGAVTGYVASLVQDDPVRSRATIEEQINENAITGFVYFNDGQPIGQLRTEEDRRIVESNDIPQQMIDALLAVEDNNFYQHLGVDINGLGRAVKQKLLNEDTQTGGSTLTQQLARRVFLSLDVTDARKLKEIFLSLRMERYLTKDEILTAYLNKMPFGNGSNGYNVFGIRAAAKGIFNITDLSQLNIAQSAYLAGLPQLPSVYSAFNGKGEYNEKGIERALERQRRVLERMLETGRITNAQYQEALQFDTRASLAKPAKKAYSTFPYLMMEAERQAAELLLLQQDQNYTLEDLRKPENAAAVEQSRQNLLRGGYRVHTTIDKKIYNLMRGIGSNKENFSPDDNKKGVEQIAAMMIDHKTGAIIGMLEGRDFYLEQMNYATQMKRQPGSAMKTIAAYLPAIESGLIQPAGVLDDAPIVLKDGQKGFHIPKNSNNRYDGLVTARDALNRSLNLPALKLFLEDVTIPKAWEFTRKLGITTLQPEDDYAQTGVIGGLSVGISVEEMTNAYGAIPNHGIFNDAYMIQKITDASGKVIYEHKPDPQRVFSEQTAFLATDMLSTVISAPGGTAHTLTSWFNKYGEIPIAGKTGTTQSYGDVWFMGFTPDVTLGVWAGYKEQVNSLSDEGRSRARKIWAEILNQATDAKPELFETKEFVQPEGIIRATVSSVTGKWPTDLTKQMGKLVTDYFNEKYLPKENDDGLVKRAFISYNGVNYLAQELTPSDFVQERTLFVRKKPIDELMDEIRAAQEQLPASDRRPLSYFLPRDASNDAPAKVDPRVDDGAAPSPPSNVRLSYGSGSTVSITFNRNNEQDVVGYRLYRSINQGPFQKNGNSIVTGQAYSFSTQISSSNQYSFYVTAVDVAGKESAPSLMASMSRTASESPGSNSDSVQSPGSSRDNSQPADSGNSGNQPQTGSGNNGNQPQTGSGNSGNQPPDDSSNDGNQSPATPGNGGNQPPDDSSNGGSSEASNPPNAPTGTGAVKTDNGIRVTWAQNPSSDQVTQYNVFYSEDGQSRFTKIGSTSRNSFDYPSTLTSGWFRVTAVNKNGESGPSGAAQLNE
ncbi:transglycosylase domain-containing protein [Paenibacillus abyssi]|uniref:Fibronectin type-III domain-containing protein n=1 Tax=Paenibacillus abyssi TaxID=1340531 RepID=A0A917G7P6_9BACL|nr:transglycosylase domain-containing protein [Paenibacillus abyssi]GGG27049.1 hypothetical protein GCM10010916_49260 [Paenibacillus abyssi]